MGNNLLVTRKRPPFMLNKRELAEKFNKTRKKKSFIIITTAILMLLIGGALYYWVIYKNDIIKSEIDRSLFKKTGGMYSITYEKFTLDEVTGFLEIKNCWLKFDSSVLVEQKNLNIEPSIIFNLFIPTITVKGVQTPGALLEQKLIGESVDINNPSIELVYTGKGKDSSRLIPKSEVYKEILGNLLELKLGQVSIRNAHFFVRKMGRKDTLINVHDFTVVLKKLLIDSTSFLDTSRLLFSEQIALSAAKTEWRNPNNLYQFQLDSFYMNSFQKFMAIQKFTMQPLLSEAAFMKARGVQTDRLNIQLQELSLINVDFQSLFDQKLIADSLLVNAGTIKVYKDMRLPRDGVNRVGTFPHQLLKKIPFDIDIRKGLVRNSYVEYSQMTPQTDAKGKIAFHDITLKLHNISNQAERIAKDRYFLVNARSSFLNQTPLLADFKFDMAASSGRFNVNASIGGLSAASLSSIAEPLASAKIDKGRINGLKANISGSDYSGYASIVLRYDDLKIAVMEVDKQSGELNKKGLISLAANILVKNSNPGINGKLRVGKGLFKRDTNRSFFNLIWKSMFVAIAETMGINAKKTAQKK